MGDKDFFLSPDDSMTMGDINYMRKPKRVRRTFPKTVSNKGGFAVETEVSANEDRSGMFKGNNNQNVNQNISANTVFNPTPSTQNQPGVTGGSAIPQTEVQQATPTAEAAPTPAPAPAPSTEERRKTDTSMDMFRNMAKNIRR